MVTAQSQRAAWSVQLPLGVCERKFIDKLWPREQRRGEGGLCFLESAKGEGGRHYYVIDSLAVFPEGWTDPGSDENVPA